jgi:hypothetical protein
VLHRATTKTGAAAQGRYAALRPAKVEQEALSLDDADVGTGMLDWLNLWQHNANNEQWPDDDFNAKQDHCSPQP